MASGLAEFDAVARDYAEQHAKSIRLSGEDPEYFAHHKAGMVASVYRTAGVLPPRDVLDFGAGIGNSVAPLRTRFPGAHITCLDVSQESLELCTERHGDEVSIKVFDGTHIPMPDASYDMVFVACVFHHIPAEEHVGLLTELNRVLRPHGRLFLFEHNPWNPLTRIAVANCPFDENAVLIDPITMRRTMAHAGFQNCRTTFGPFFPAFLARLRGIEPFLGWLPLGAQYLIHGVAG